MAVEPLYGLAVAAELIPFGNRHSLYVWLSKNRDRFPPRYRRVGRHEVRLLSESEILRIRDEVVTAESRYTRRERGAPTFTLGDLFQ